MILQSYWRDNMYFLNRGHTWKFDGLEPNGVILRASSIYAHELTRRDIPDSKLLIFDPQMYFPLEYANDCSKTYKKLGTYGHYNDKPPEYDSQVIKLRDFNKNISTEILQDISIPEDDEEIRERINSCIDLQKSLDVSNIILPSPLIVDAEDQFSCQLKWINIGVEIAENLGKPLLATIAFSEDVLLHKSFENNNLLQTIIDNVTVIDNLEGFYIVVSRNSAAGNCRITEKNIVQSLIELSYILGYQSDKMVFHNFCDDLGFVCISAGAYAFGSGYTNKEKRLNFDDFVDQESGGGPLPHFYSPSLLGDFYADRDMSKIRDARLLKYFNNDFTAFSESLKKALHDKNEISMVSEWRESKNNVTAAKNHRIQIMTERVEYLNSLDFKDKIYYTLEWLQNAEAIMNYLNTRFEDDPLSEYGKHLPVWRKCFESFIEKYNLI